MLTYFHGFIPGFWEQYEKVGLLNKNSGVRFCESLEIEEPLKFNNLARKGGELYSLIKSNNLPFYIDRLQGGCFLEKYPYDMELVKEYKNILGEKFFGFQMHEWSSNYLNDLNKLDRNNCAEWTKEAIEEAVLREFKYPNVFLEAMSAEEMLKTGKPQSYKDFVKVCEWLFSDRQNYVNGDLITCNSYFLAPNLEFKRGLKRTMPEIGAQTPNTRFQMAYARGMTKAYGAMLGAYYEPWGGQPFSACCYQKDNKNEWNIGSETFPFETQGENGGSSRSMQERMQLYAYFAGAEFFAEEWGVCNTFYDWNDFCLTPYGKIKRDFIRFTEKYEDIGTPVTPIAIVLPENLAILDTIDTEENKYLGFSVTGSVAEELKNIRKVLKMLFCETEEMMGTEKTSLLNCTVPDAIDIVHADKFNPDDYEYFVDLSGSDEFARKYSSKICKAEDVPELLDRILPFSAKGGAMKQLTRLRDGSYYLLLTNNSGVERTVANGERFLKEADSVVDIAIKEGLSLIKLEGKGEVHIKNDGMYFAEIPAGSWILCKIGK